MDVLKGCLIAVGVAALLFVGSCMYGVSVVKTAIATTVDPQLVTATVSQPADVVRGRVFDYFDRATNTGFREPIKADALSDGSVRLVVGAAEPYLARVDVKIVANADKTTTATFTYNADKLAWGSADKVMSTKLHRAMKAGFERAMEDIGKGNDVDATLDFATLLDKSAPSTAFTDALREAARESREDRYSEYRSSSSSQRAGVPDRTVGRPASQY